MNAQTLLAVLGGAVVVITFIGTAVVYLRGSFEKGEFERLERMIHVRDEEIEGLNSKMARVERDNADLRARVQVLEQENERLVSLRPSAEAIHAIDRFLREDHDVTAKKILEIVTALS